MPPSTITMLTGLTTAELTLTKRGANNRRYALTKGSIPMDPEVLQNLISTPAEGEAEFLETLKSQGITEQEQIDAAVASLRIQKGLKDLVNEQAMESIIKSSGYVAKAEPAKKMEDGEDGKKKPPFMKKKEAAKKSIDLSQLDDASRAAVEAVFKSAEDTAAKSAELEKVVKSLLDERTTAGFIAKAAKDFAHIPGSDEEIGAVLKSAHDASPELAKGLETLLARLDETVAKSALLTTMGAVQKTVEGGAWQKIEALANGMVQKSASSGEALSKHAAIDLVLKTEQGQALYREYLGDNPRQRADVNY